MRITYLHQYFNTPEMSGSTRSYEIARRLVAKGHEVNMVTSWREDSSNREEFQSLESGIQVHWLPVPYSGRMGYKQRIKSFKLFAQKAAKKAAALPADVILASSTPLTIALPGAYAAWRRKAPMVFEVRDLWPELPIALGVLQNPLLKVAARQLERFAYSRSRRIVALSPGMKEGVLKTGYPAEKVTVIPNSSDLELFDPGRVDRQVFRAKHPELGTAPFIVYTGSIGKINGVDYLPRIAKAAAKQGFGIQFVTVGQGQEEEEVRAEAERLGVLGSNFHMYPPLPKRDMPEVLAAADLALSLVIDLEALWHNSANKLFDALAAGTPVAINYGGWQAELLQQTGAGMVLPQSDPEEAARRLAGFVQDKSALKAAGQKARELAEERFCRDKLSQEMEKVLLSAVDSSL
ncbi:MAG: glycosyltransferase family 4 protein [Desulfohalobiaceae bacterium]